MAESKLEDQIKAVVLERCVHYRERLDAHAAIPDGTRAEFDVTVRIKGTLTKGQVTLTAPLQRNDFLCRRVVSETAKALKIKPADLKAALSAAAKKATRKREWVGDENVNLKDPHVAAIIGAELGAIRNLKQKPKSGSVRVDADVKFQKRSAVAVG